VTGVTPKGFYRKEVENFLDDTIPAYDNKLIGILEDIYAFDKFKYYVYFNLQTFLHNKIDQGGKINKSLYFN